MGSRKKKEPKAEGFLSGVKAIVRSMGRAAGHVGGFVLDGAAWPVSSALKSSKK